VFVRKFLPETKGLSVEEIIKVFERRQKSGPLGGSGKPATVTNSGCRR
jgi:hypothetical protein